NGTKIASDGVIFTLPSKMHEWEVRSNVLSDIIKSACFIFCAHFVKKTGGPLSETAQGATFSYGI
ncbi:MAG: hypothetical protein ABJN42_21215, partial [Roseibium sp.]|uniref:hypothetical protein n=1 Tax=Roseibium sp. TaxID=1936156 RepID=UPI003299FCD7